MVSEYFKNTSIKKGVILILSYILVTMFWVTPKLWSVSIQRKMFNITSEEAEDDKILYLEMWEHMINISNNLPVRLNTFKMRLKKNELVLMLEMLEDFSKTMDKYNLTYFMDAGTLLGSYRHHGMIPWDDDIDLFADVEQYKQVRTALDTIKDKYVVSVHSKGLLKLHSKNDSNNTLYITNTNTKTFPWKWPFLDIFWFHRSGSRMQKLYNNAVYRVSDIFPLKKRPFGTLMLNSPCNTSLFLTNKFQNWNLCSAPAYSHKRERGTGFKRLVEDCGVMYPVVQRKHLTDGTILEYLHYNNTLSSSFVECV